MISDADREAIERSVAAMDIGSWPPLTSVQRDLVARAFRMSGIPSAEPEHLEEVERAG